MTLSKERLTSIAVAPGLDPCDYEETYSSITTGEIQAMARELLERRERDKQEPVRYMNRFTGACYTLAQQPDAATDTAVYVPLYAEPPAPVLPESLLSAVEEVLRISDRQHDAWDKAKAALSACRATMLKQPASIQTSDSASSGAGIKQPASNGQSFGNSEQLEPVSHTYTLRDGLAAIRKLGPIDAEKIQAERDALNSPAVPDGWIKCSERMPEMEGDCLVWVDASSLDGYCDHQAIAAYQGGEWSNAFNWLVTHWMPLPAAPKQESE